MPIIAADATNPIWPNNGFDCIIIDEPIIPDDTENEIDIEIEYEDDDEDKDALKLDENKSEITPYENKNIISRILRFIWNFLSWLKIKFKK